MEKVPEMMPNGRPGDAFWSTLGLGKRHRHVQKESFGMRMSGVYFRRPPGPIFFQKLRHNEMAEIVFGLHRREQIAYLPFSEKVVPGPTFS